MENSLDPVKMPHSVASDLVYTDCKGLSVQILGGGRVVRRCCVSYITADIGLQLGKACYPCSR